MDLNPRARFGIYFVYHIVNIHGLMKVSFKLTSYMIIQCRAQ